MGFLEWKRAKDKEKEKASSSSSNTSSNTTETADASATSFMEWVKNKKEANAQTSAKGWLESGTRLVNEMSDHYSKYNVDDEDKYKTYQSKASELLSVADSWRKKYAGNKEAISAIDSMVSALSDIKQNAMKARDYYSQWKDEDTYNTDMMDWLEDGSEVTPEKAKARKGKYQSNVDRIAEIDEEINNLPKEYLRGGGVQVHSKYKDKHEALKKERDRLQAENTMYERTQGKTDSHFDVTQNEDFEEVSSEKGTVSHDVDSIYGYMSKIDPSTWKWENGTYVDAFGTPIETDGNSYVHPESGKYSVDDPLGLYFDAVENDTWQPMDIPNGINDAYLTDYNNAMLKGSENDWNQLKPEEIAIYYYYLNTEGKEKAMSFLDDMTMTLNKRREGEVQENIANANGFEKFLLNVGSVPANIFGGTVALADDAINALTGQEYNPYSYGHALQNTAQVVREETAKDFVEATGGATFIGMNAGDVYQALMSGADSLVGSAMGGTAYGLFMGASSASSEMKRLYEEGASGTEMIAGGFLAGAAEMFFEKYSIDKFVKMGDTKTKLGVLVNFLKQGGVEASEEALTSIANTITDFAVRGNNSDISKNIDAYISQGMSQGEATLKALKDVGFDIYKSAMSGFISGGGMGGVASTANYIGYQADVTNQGREILGENGVPALKALAEEVSGVTEGKLGKNINKLSGKVSATEIKGKNKLSTSIKNLKNANAVGKLSDMVETARISQNTADVVSALMNKGLSSKEAKKSAEMIIDSLNKGETKATFKDSRVAEVYNELVGEGESKLKESISERNIQHTATRLGIDIKNRTVDGKSIEKEVDTEGKVAESGKTTRISTGEAVTIDKDNAIAKIKVVDGVEKVFFNTDKGVVEATDIQYKNESEALIYESFTDLHPSIATAAIKAYDGKISAQKYIKGMREGILLYGKHNFQAVGKDISVFSDLAQLSEADQALALKLGKAVSNIETSKAYKALKSAIKSATERAEKDTAEGKKIEKRGKVSFSEGAKVKGQSQKRAVTLAKVLTKAIGIDIVFYDSMTTTDEDLAGSNGAYRDGTIYLDLQHSTKDAHTIAFTMSHELVHFVKEYSPAKFKVFADFLIDEYGKHGVSTSTMLANKMAALEESDPDVAFEEMIADACETMLLDSNVMLKLAKLKQIDLDLFEKIRLHILDILNKIRAEYKKMNYAPTSDEAKALLKMEDVIEQLYEKFEDMVVDATETFQTIGSKDTPSKNIKKQAKSTNSNVYDYSKTFEEQIDDYKKGLIPANDTLLVSGTPKVWQDVGFNALPVTINQTHVDYALNGTKDFDHHIGEAKLKDLPNAIKNPLAIIQSQTKQDRAVVILETEHNGKKIISAIEVDGYGTANNISIDSNSMTTLFAKGNALAQLKNAVDNTVNGGVELFYWNKKETISLLQTVGLQLPNHLPQDGFVHSIRENGSKVKIKFDGVTETQQFKRWFGDWQNNPKKASKVVNADGTPKIMYHGSPEDFTVFDRKKARPGTYGRGFYFTDSNSHGGQYGNVKAFYLNIKNPLDASSNAHRITQNQLRAFLNEVAQNEDYGIENYGEYATVDSLIKSFAEKSDFDVLQDINATCIGDFVAAIELFNQINGTKYDGIITPTETVTFSATQQKSATDNIGTFDPNNPDVRFQKKRNVEPITNDDIAKVKSHFGTTTNFDFAGYLLTDGKMLDFSGRHWGNSYPTGREVDHRDVLEAFDYEGTHDGNNGVNAMVDMIGGGNIRLMPEVGGINLAVAPNEAQRSTLLSYIRYFRGEVIIDIDEVGGDTVHTFEYNKGTAPMTVIRDIMAYFEEGAIPKQQPEYRQFLYQKKRDSYAPTFYSKMERVIDDIKINKMGAGGVVSYLTGKGVKKEEIKWSGIETFLEGKKSLTKEELQEFVKGSQIAIEEQINGGGASITLKPSVYGSDSWDVMRGGEVLDTYSWSEDSELYESDTTGGGFSTKDRILEYFKEKYGSGNTRWGDYKLDGGSNYRELVFKMPNSSYSNQAMKVHWDEEGVLAHARIQDLETTDGKKMLFVEEIQSDWHNAGHKHGYQTMPLEEWQKQNTKVAKVIMGVRNELLGMNDRIDLDRINSVLAQLPTEMVVKVSDTSEFEITYYDVFEDGKKIFSEEPNDWVLDQITDYLKLVNWSKNHGGTKEYVPEAPFRKNYHEYVLKRLVRMAAEEGYDSIGWTTADIQMDRWNPQRQTNRQMGIAEAKNPNAIAFERGYQIEYDEGIKSYLEDFGEKLGAKVGKADVQTKQVSDKEEANILMAADILEDGDSYIREQMGIKEVWSMDITDTMKNSVLYEGQPKFQKKRPSNRELLSNALETTIDNSTIEGKLQSNVIERYKESIAKVEELEAHLAEVKKEIYELSFKKGSRDMARLRELREDKMMTENRINTYDRRLLEIESTKPMKDLLQREKEMVRKRYEAEGREKVKTAIARKNESLAFKKERENLLKLVLSTAKWLESPGKNEVKCPDILRKPFANFLASIDTSSKSLLKKGEATRNDYKFAMAMDSLATAIDRIKSAQDPNAETDGENASADLGGYLDLPEKFAENIRLQAEGIKSFIDMANNGDSIINDMSADELKELSKIIKILKKGITDMQTLYTNYRFANAQALGKNTMEYADSLGEAKDSTKLKDFAVWDNTVPYYAFRRFGEGGESIFESLMDSQDKLAFLADDILKFKERNWTDKEVSAWSKDTHTIDLPSGRKISLTTADAMSIFCLSRRYQGKQHLVQGGVRVVGLTKKGKKLPDVKANLAIIDVDAIADSLTDRQKEVAKKIQEYMSTKCAEWGNEIWMKRFLTTMFNEENYFPIESDPNVMDYKDPARHQSDLFRLLNISATKPLTEGANNRVVIRNIFDVFSTHSSDMARLNAYGMSLLDYMKWLNYREKAVNIDNGEIQVTGVRNSLETAYGSAAMKYIVTLIKDINGSGDIAKDNSFAMQMMRGSKTAAVGANLRVALLQFTSLPRASLVLDPRSIALGLGKKPSIEKAKKYCGMALWKSFGFYDTNIGKSIESQIKGDRTVTDKIIEVSLKGAELGDSITWGYLWNACEYEIAKSKKYKVGTEEFNQAVANKLREVIYASQVVDSTLTRSQMMRSKSGLNQMLSAFMSEPTLTYNIHLDALSQFNNEKRRTKSAKLAWQATKGVVVRSISTIMVTNIIVSIAEALADALRDDEDETFGEKFIDGLWKSFVSNINPLNKIPVASDIMGWIEAKLGIGYFSSDRLDTQYLTTLSNAYDAWVDIIKNGKDAEKTIYYAIYNTAKATSQITGLPTSNAMREVTTLWNNTAGAADKTLKLRNYDLSNEKLGNELYEAIVKGKDRQAESLKHQFEDEKSMNNALIKAIRENNTEVVTTASKLLNGDVRSYDALVKKLVAQGFDEMVVSDAIRSVKRMVESAAQYEANGDTESYNEKVADLVALGYDKDQLLEDIDMLDKSPQDTDKAESVYTKDDYVTTVLSGDTTLASTIKEDLIDTMMENGKTEEEAEESLINALNTRYKTEYAEGRMSDSEVTSWVRERSDSKDTEADIYWAVKEWKARAENMDVEDYSYSKYAEFHQAILDGDTRTMNAFIQECRNHTNRKTNKEVASDIASAITSHFKPVYKEASPAERVSLKAKILNAYAQLGYARSNRSKLIDKWLED